MDTNEIRETAADDAAAYCNCRSVREIRAALRDKVAFSSIMSFGGSVQECASYDAAFRAAARRFVTTVLA